MNAKADAVFAHARLVRMGTVVPDATVVSLREGGPVQRIETAALVRSHQYKMDWSDGRSVTIAVSDDKRALREMADRLCIPKYVQLGSRAFEFQLTRKGCSKIVCLTDNNRVLFQSRWSMH